MTCPQGEEDPTGCFDCAVGGSNPVYTPNPRHEKAVRDIRSRFARPSVGEATNLYLKPIKPAEGPAPQEVKVLPQGSFRRLPMASDKQMLFIRNLENERQMMPDVRVRLQGRLAANDLDIDTAGRTITWLLKQPFKGKATPLQDKFVWAGSDVRPVLPAAVVKQAMKPELTVPEGRYAIEDPTDSNKLRFIKVDKPKDGKWAGRTFISVQASDDFWPLKDWAKRDEVLRLISVDIKTAMLRYGTELGVCGQCGRTLTDAESRAAGIGPICAGKPAWG